MSRDGGPSGRDVNGRREISNEDFRSLVLRAQWAEDHAATEELVTYLLRIIKPMAGRFPDRSEHDDVVVKLTLAGLRAAKVTVVKHVEKPRNYTVRAIGNAFLSLCRERTRLPRLEQLEDHLEASDPRATQGYDHVHVRDLIQRFRAEQTSDVGVRIADVLDLSYHLGCSDLVACRLLSFDPTQTDTVLRTKRRWRETPGSSLKRLADQLFDPCPEIGPEPDKRRSSD